MLLTVKELFEREDFFHAAILRHGFTDYMRDDEIIVGARNGPPETDIHKNQFIGCVEAAYQSTSDGWFSKSLSDDLVLSGADFPEKQNPPGFVWGVRYATAYPGLKYVDDGARAEYWSRKVGRKMHEVLTGTNVYSLRLVFADIRYSFLRHEPDVTVQKDYPLRVDETTSDGGVRQSQNPGQQLQPNCKRIGKATPVSAARSSDSAFTYATSMRSTHPRLSLCSRTRKANRNSLSRPNPCPNYS